MQEANGHRLPRTLVLAAAIATLAAAFVAVPAVAQTDPRIAIVQGIADARVDVCVDGQEIRSGLRYGRKDVRSLDAGQHRVVFFRADSRECRGERIAARTFDLVAGADITVVVTARTPRIVVFDNAPVAIGEIDQILVRHAADIGPAVISASAAEFLTPVAPTALPPIFRKGDEWVDTFTDPIALTISVHRPRQLQPILGPLSLLTQTGRRYEFIVVGSTKANARLVTLVRPTLPAPLS